ncbi:DUF6461 domain-containing protein [Embleya sp. NBC_00888]|uniref:DUF6461 domain-containing protein n=1 Tax=Embleya sp. NBC_00888 TaxID=2975960 RepID=UPI003867012D
MQGRCPGRGLDRHTEAVLVYGDCNPVAYLIHARDGEIVCGFEAYAPGHRFGTDPDRLLPHMIAAGLLGPDGHPPDDGTQARGCELRTAESAFGLDLPHHDVVHGLLLAAGLREDSPNPYPSSPSQGVSDKYAGVGRTDRCTDRARPRPQTATPSGRADATKVGNGRDVQSR